MYVKRFSIATLAGGVSFFVMGALIYEIILGEFMAANMTLTMKDPPEWAYLALSQLFLGAVLALVFIRWAGISKFGQGATAGAKLGFLFAASVAFDFYGTSTALTLNAALLEPILGAIRGAVAGGVIGLVLGKMGD